MTRKEFAQQIVIQLISRNHDPRNVAKLASDIVSEMYKGYHDEPSFEVSTETREQVPIVSIAEQDGEKGVRLCVGDIDIFINAHDLDDGKKYEWPDAMKRLKEVGKDTFNKHQSYFIAAFKDEINEKMREIGGKEFDDVYWSSTEYGSFYAWGVNFHNGYINYYHGKNHTLAVRPVAAFKKIKNLNI